MSTCKDPVSPTNTSGQHANETTQRWEAEAVSCLQDHHLSGTDDLCSVKPKLMGSAGREVVGRKARLAGNGLVLAQRRNTANDRFTARPKGAIQMLQYCVAVLEKDMPFPADCVLSWNIWVALNPPI